MSVSPQQLQVYIDQVFAQFDRDGSGSLDVNEMANFFNTVFQRMGDPTRINQQ
jgi:Ca2+-binding EF-hand superfamily protein